MSTKLRGDIAEQAAVLQALKLGWEVLKPVGDRLPYDLVFDVQGQLVKIQVRCAWLDTAKQNYVVDNRRTKTNRRQMLRSSYSRDDFEFALAYLEQLNLFYVFPSEVFISYGSQIHLVEADKRQRKPKSAEYRDAWVLISQWAVYRETCMRTSLKFGEAASGVIPSQASSDVASFCHLSKVEEGVETRWETP